MSGSADEILHKVTALIIEKRSSEPHLLTINHPTAGRQIPAGTVERGEAIAAAVLRETREETGLLGRIVAQIGQAFDPLPPERRIILQPVRLLSSPDPNAPKRPFRLSRGSFVDIDPHRYENGLQWGVYEVFDLNVSPPKLLARTSGWVEPQFLTTRQLRHTFQISPTAPSPDTWWHDADGHRWKLTWVPLAPPPALIDPQDRWLADAAPLLNLLFP